MHILAENMLLNIKFPIGKADGWVWEKIMTMAGEDYLEWAISRVSALTNNNNNGMEKETLSKLDITRSSSTEWSNIYGTTLYFLLFVWNYKGSKLQLLPSSPDNVA